jgi:soluble lytic murein transglycosylase
MKWISLTLLIFLLLPQRLLNSSPLNYSNEIVNSADSLYSIKLYKQALQKYLYIAQSDDHIFDDPKFDFKLAYCYYKNNQYFHSNNILTYSKLLENYLPEYTDYLKFKSGLYINQDWHKIEQSAINFINIYNDHFLADSVINHIAGYYFENRNYEKAKKYYSDLYKRNSKNKKSSFINKQIAICDFELGTKDVAMDKMMQILKKYPGSKDALELVQFIQERRLDDEELFFPIVDVYLSHGYVKYLKNKLEAFISSSEDKILIEKARYYLFRVSFVNGDYKTALNGFENLYSNLKDEKLKPKILVYIARCYLRLDNKEKSAEIYIKYSEEFPRRRLAPECAWKAAWIYEELNNLRGALEQYRVVQYHWPRNSFRFEAKFREALTLYRLSYYSDSALIFKEIINSNWNTLRKNKAKYWLALTYKKLGLYDLASDLLLELGMNVFEDFYTMKAYLIEKSKIDSILFTNEKLSNNKNPLEQYISNIAYDTELYSRLFLINELMGKEFVLQEIASKKYKPNDLAGWVSQAEIYKKLGDYNNAFKIYDMIDYTYFGDYGILDKPFILKEKYPFYFDSQIGNLGSEKNLDKYFILAIIRAESGFDKNAHSSANAYGLMQIIPRTANELASELKLNFTSPVELFNEDLNLQLGIYYVSKLARKYENQKEYILAAYNAGPHRVSRWKNYNNNETLDFIAENIEFTQTRNYIKKVMKNYWIYSLLDDIY